VLKSSKTLTDQPALVNPCTRCDPMNPAPPVT